MTARQCRCRGFTEMRHDHDDTYGDCPRWSQESSGLCSDCDVQRYAAIGRAAERLHELLDGTSES
jgi:hypothetical protein